MRVLKPINRNRTKRRMAEKAIARTLALFFEHNKATILKPLLASYKPRNVEKSLPPDIEAELNRLLLKLDLEPFKDLPADLQKDLEGLAKDGMVLTVRRMSDQLPDEAFNSMLKLVNERAVKLAKTASATLIKNFADTTPEMLRADISQALQDGWTQRELASVLMENRGFSEVRANMIARTEVADMDIKSNMEMWRESGVVKAKIWLVSEDPCEDCLENAGVGQIPFDEEFPNGDCPVHPNCTCDIAPVVED